MHPIWVPALRGHRRFLPTYFAPHIEKLPYGATECFCSPNTCFIYRYEVHFAEKEACDLSKEAAIARVLIEAHLSHFSSRGFYGKVPITGTWGQLL